MSWKSRQSVGESAPGPWGGGPGAPKAQGWTLGGDTTQDRARETSALASLLRSPDARGCPPLATPDGKPVGGEPGRLDLGRSRWAAGMAAGPCRLSSAPAHGVLAELRLSPPMACPAPASISLFLALSGPCRGGRPL